MAWIGTSLFRAEGNCWYSLGRYEAGSSSIDLSGHHTPSLAVGATCHSRKDSCQDGVKGWLSLGWYVGATLLKIALSACMHAHPHTIDACMHRMHVN